MKNKKRTNLKSKRKMSKKRQRMLLFLCIDIALGAVIVGFFLFMVLFPSGKDPEVETLSIVEEKIPDKEPLPTTKPEPEMEEAEEVEETVKTPPAEYPFQTEEVTVQIEDLSKEYTIAWVSDLHMITDHSAGDVQEEFLETVEDRYETLSITEDGVHGDELWPEIIRFLNMEDYDGIIFGGDMMDYCSHSNMDAFLKQYELIKDTSKVMYIRADHDYGEWYGGDVFSEEDAHKLHEKVDGDSFDQKYMDFDEFTVVGIDNSTKDMSEDEYDWVKTFFEKDKPLIIATHVPYASKVDDSLKELSMKVRNEVYYWSKDGRFYPNERTNKYIHKVRGEDTPVVQVLAGHLHASWDGEMIDGLPEHIFAPAFSGTIGIIHIVPKITED